jgi:hypothetical protein
MNLAELRRLVTNYSGRTDPDFVNNVDDFIRLGHRFVERAWFGREQHFLGWVYQSTIPAGQRHVVLPATYRPSVQLTLHLASAAAPDDFHPLERVPIEAMHVEGTWRLSDGTTINLYDLRLRGRPRAYCVMGRQLHTRPAAETDYHVWLTAGTWAEPLRYDSDETVVSQSAPEAVLYAALREAWSFLGDPVQKATWEAEATRAIEAWMRDGTQEETTAHGIPLVMDVYG